MTFHIPMTGSYLSDFAVLALLFVGGLLWAVKGGNRLGWVAIAVAGLWAAALAKILLRM